MTYWANKAALLDPRCYEYVIGPSWCRTVPAGETWFALNLWWLNAASSWLFHRPLNVDQALALPEGTMLSPVNNVPGGHGFAYLAKPKIVIDLDPRYTSDPKGLYESRIERLNSLPLRHTSVTIPAGSSSGVYSGTLFDWGDTETQYAMLRHTSIHDVCWAIMVGNKRDGVHMDAMNTLNEVSDSHTNRLAQPTICPFARNLWNGIWAQQASRAGNYSNHSEAVGHAVVTWSKLPTDW